MQHQTRQSTATAPRDVGSRPVVLVVPPFQDITRPSLGVSQLKANLVAQGFATEIVYLNLRFAERLDPRVYTWIGSQGNDLMMGEVLFSHALFEHPEGSLERYRTEILGELAEKFQRHFYPGISSDDALRRLISACRDFCTGEAVEAVLARDPWFVGFSSSFQQNCSSLAVIRGIKQRRPDVLAAMGGANCDGEMGIELFERFGDLDFVGRGECDHSLVALVRSLRDGERGHGIRGILARGQEPGEGSEPLDGEQLDALPLPDFQEYFEQVGASSLADRVVPGLVMETSRGCWWGAKQHCTFCGLNGSGMVFRAKSPDRAISEMKTLIDRYSVPRIQIVDNILDMGYFKNVLPDLAGGPVGNLFYETKANLSREQVEMLAKARVRWIQPGIESLSDGALKLMRKGASELQNVQLLKWCAESGISVIWSLLFGFPGEDEDEMPRIQEHAEAIHHLGPPARATTLILDRFSPYFETPEQWGLTPVGPAPMYRFVYPFPDESLARIAYVYTTPVFENKEKTEAFEHLTRIWADWSRSHARSHLVALPRRKNLWLFDTRKCAVRKLHRLSGPRRRILEYCDRARGERDIIREFENVVDAEAIREMLRVFVSDKLMLESGGRYLSLAVSPGPDYRKFVPWPGGWLVDAQPTVRIPLRRRMRTSGTSPAAAVAFAKSRLRMAKSAVRSMAERAAVYLATNFSRSQPTG